MTCLFFSQVFNELELPAEIARLQELKTNVVKERSILLHNLVNLCNVNNSDLLSHKLAEYEEVVQDTVQGGVSLPFDSSDSVPATAKWNLLQAVFFASTVLTTIGKCVSTCVLAISK